jgi:NAD(P)-dependent dehydrogenase (short-subunit alcohol dehydrogenase family)
LTTLGSGIGREVALTLAVQGATLLLCADLSIENAEETVRLAKSIREAEAVTSQFEAVALDVDLRKEAEVKALFARAKTFRGRFDICVNTAGVRHCYTILISIDSF